MRFQTKFIVLLLILISLSMSAMAVVALMPSPSTIQMYPSYYQNSVSDNVSMKVRVIHVM